MITIQKDLEAYENESLWQYYKDIPAVNNDGDNNNGDIHNNRDKSLCASSYFINSR